MARSRKEEGRLVHLGTLLAKNRVRVREIMLSSLYTKSYWRMREEGLMAMHPERKRGVELRVGTLRHTDGWRVKEATFGVFMTTREEVVPCNGKPVGLFSHAHLTLIINLNKLYII